MIRHAEHLGLDDNVPHTYPSNLSLHREPRAVAVAIRVVFYENTVSKKHQHMKKMRIQRTPHRENPGIVLSTPTEAKGLSARHARHTAQESLQSRQSFQYY